MSPVLGRLRGPGRARSGRLLLSLAVAGGVMLAGSPVAVAQPNPAPALPSAPAGAGGPAAAAAPATPSPAVRTVCTLTDQRLPELSGLVAVKDRFLAMNDGGDRLTVYVLDSSCRVVDVRSADVDPYDPEDLAVAADGTVWLADTGDNRTDRPTVALLALRGNGAAAVYRLTYPDGPHDAEALLLAPDGTPYIVTKEVLGVSGVYRPAARLQSGGTVPMEKVTTVRLALTGTPGGPVGRAGELLVTGGAVSPDGRFLALRTYTDAYLWPLAGSDVAGALAHAPERIPLPQERQGEAISFGADDRQLVVSGEGLPVAVQVVTVPAPAPLPGAGTTGETAAGSSGVPAWGAALIAALVATVVVWLGGVLLRLHGPAGRR